MKPTTQALPRVRALTSGLASMMAGSVAIVLLSASCALADEGVATVGRDRFVEKCGVCHGADGKGAGPFASLLTKKPSDLTVLSASAGGSFPFDRILESIDGRASVGGAHGTRDMPIWGGEWKTDSLVAETALRGRILEIIIYIRTLQQ